jgi:hypothetical protein
MAVDDPGRIEDVARTWPMSTPRGVASSSTSVASRMRASALGTMSTAMSAEATESAAAQPLTAITSAATATAADPATSPSTSRYAPRRLRLTRCASRRMYSDAPLAARPTRAIASMRPEATAGGSASRRQASTRTNAATPSTSIAFTIAARISRRR